MKWCLFRSRFIYLLKRHLVLQQLQFVAMDAGTKKRYTPVEDSKNAHTEKESKHDKRYKKKRKYEEQESQKEDNCGLNSIPLTDNLGIPLSKHACRSAASILLSNDDHNDDKTVNNTNVADHSVSSSSDHLRVLGTDSSSVIPVDTVNLFSRFSPTKGVTFLRTSTPYMSNMVPNVAAMFQAASQYHNMFGVPPQYHPFGYVCRTTSTAVLHQTLHQQSQSVGSKANSVSRQPGTAAPSAGPAVKEMTSISAGVIGHPRQWEYTDYGRQHRSRAKQGSEISVMSYNILAQNLLEEHSYLYEDHGDEALTWNYRSHRLLQEIAFHHSDVVCLQEVQSDHYSNFINPELQNQGYDGVYLKRTGDKCDGCAIFFKRHKFSLIKSHNVEFKRGGLLDRDNIAVILELRPRSRFYMGSVKKICVATTHLLFNPRRGDVKMGQLMVLLAELDRCARSSDGTYTPVVLCGDFNLEPYSHLYKMIYQGYLRFEGLSCNELSGQKEGAYGKDNYISRNMCEKLNISDHCQYMAVKERMDERVSGEKGDSTDGNNANVSAWRKSPDVGEISTGSIADISKHAAEYKNKWTSHHHTAPNSEVHNKSSEHSNKNIGSGHLGSGLLGSGHLGSGQLGWGQLGSGHLGSDHLGQQSQGTPASGQIRHSFNFVSSYNHYIERLKCRVPEVTTQHRRAACTVDYIFYNVHKKIRCKDRGRWRPETVQEGKLVLLARYGLMSSREINKLGTMPNQMMPSDHLPLVSQFLLRS
ncbi:uncharacterized protein LOC121370259 isoform X2 [Gigantopelta aegis]|uniref:uncharacterized protein LOC121370259 isoform X2 n=1 Tax=Gigantopelta aegis TaxID=1735272 RepID=UPI001B88CE31|nr:uncharacterized protein LOC121370259 isoform X2 [Gigantopelta aegis]